jgi:hypothetical protein
MRRARKPMASLREREQRRTRDPLPAQLLKYLRLRPRPPTEEPSSTTKKPARS